ncbi:hypothetical protein T11_16428 [Trichinella zimbabwensis]|uniref:Uncharacterized protein n=1 Tax=Trichinella zimbabwensis TaxID=268475 RepID=A0A0V1GIG7_9BILA|nr:hypothetical protein T11_2085 [Trichinella zimbabwensis]KRY98039.1 hypothetical protein T11_9519 [Trichinella zimbabwensis]KRY98686.1 hypothetical protein T11_16428 [Trichinella zimbabwensis]
MKQSSSCGKLVKEEKIECDRIHRLFIKQHCHLKSEGK